ncbi:GDP-mannose 4,6-dehydratase [Methylomonas sp. SURF-2]|uniref:GDP-mannose 4,6-dehydratase n=1 Tax=Methylomonas subterranea TaxID=2952225 RepID=A0ABT1TH19_9GAMM|nr:GDP-mannose 4,6-dehydratase [Methylomonas sp. SURF-2]MCQ8104538.1 GDP-mannose 4,6-dehydratase [Methylomonas sp. SURF-2]
MQNSSKSAFITGITGQDGWYLAHNLLAKGYRVHGIARHLRPGRHCVPFDSRIELMRACLTDPGQIKAALLHSRPDEIYNLAAFSRTYASRAFPEAVFAVNGLGAVSIFDLARDICPGAKIFQASSSEMFGKPPRQPQNEATPFNPLNPYAEAKIYAHAAAADYRNRHGQFIACGILFNHESERSAQDFALQKIAHGAACARLGLRESPLKNELGMPMVSDGRLHMGNLTAARDWGYARDYVEAMWKVLQHDTPDDFVIGTGHSRDLETICEIAYRSVNLDWRNHVQTDTGLLRPVDAGRTQADTGKIAGLLGWQAETSMAVMLGNMIDAQTSILAAELNLSISDIPARQTCA